MTDLILPPLASPESAGRAMLIGGGTGHPIVTPPREQDDPTADPADLPTQTGGGTGTEDGGSTIVPPNPADQPPQTSGAESPPAPYVISNEDKASAAIRSINHFNILDPPISLEFGTINPRKLKASGVNLLVESFSDMFTPFKPDSMIRVLMKMSDIDPNCINLDITKGPRAPLLKLTASGKKEGKKLIACGGNHRLAAVHRLINNCNKKAKGLEKEKAVLEKSLEKGVAGTSRGKGVKKGGTTKTAKGKGSKAKGKGKGAGTEDSTDADVVADIDSDNEEEVNSDQSMTLVAASTIEGINKQLADIERQKTHFSTWGIIVYDAGMFCVFLFLD